MKVKVIQGFRDRYTNERYLPGKILDMKEERIKEVLEKGKLVEEIKEEKPNKEELERWKLQELKALAKSLGEDDSGKKEELIERICSVDV